MDNALNLLKSFCNFDFSERACEKALSLLTEDICWFGTSEQEDVNGIAAARAYISKEMEALPSPYQVDFCEESYTPVSPDSGVAFLKMNLENEGVKISIRATAASRMENGEPKLCTMHFSVPDSAQQPGEYFPLTKGQAKIAYEKKELVASTMAGGLIGTYIKPGFPLYFVGNRMLEYLGYGSKAEFEADIDGLIENAVHPDDWVIVDTSVRQQIAETGQYTVEYRLRKQDGSYLWVHDIGRKTISEDGEDVMISVCYDITEQRQKQIQLDNLINALPGGVALYRFADDDLEILYQSNGVGALTGRTPEEYVRLMQRSAKDSIYKEDVERVFAAIRKASESDEIVSLDYRVPHKNGGCIWINGSFRKAGTEDGKPIIHAVFGEMPQIRELFGDMVENSGVALIVSDNETQELLYANPKALEIHNKTGQDYQGKLCYKFLLGYDKPCDVCRSAQDKAFQSQPMEIHNPILDRYFITQGRIINWAGRKAHIEYLTDITQTKKAEQQFSEMLQNITSGVVVCEADPEMKSYTIQYINEGFCRLFEASEAELRQRFKQDVYAFIHPEDVDKSIEMTRRLLTTKTHTEGVLRFMFPENRIKWLWISVRAVARPDGLLTSYSTYYDVTTQFEQEQQLHDILNYVPGGVCLYRWDGKKIHPIVVSKQLSRLLGEDAEALLESVTGLQYPRVHPKDLPGLQQAILEAFERTGKIDHTYRSFNSLTGEYRWHNLQGIAVPQPDGTQLAYVSHIDITNERLVAQKLAASEKALDVAAEAAGLWFWKYDPATDRVYYKEKAMRDFNLPEMAENYPQSWLDQGYILPKYHNIYRNAVAQIKNGVPQVVFEAQTRFLDGSSHWAEFRFTHLPDVEEESRLVVCTARLIDLEKSLLAKYEVERQKPSLGEKDLLLHAIFNLDTGRTEEYEDSTLGRPLTTQYPTMEQAIRFVVDHIIGEDSRKQMLKLNNCAYLREQLGLGNTSFSMDYRRKLSNGHTVWVRNILHLVPEPITKELLLFEYCYDINEQKMAEEVLRLAGKQDYERIACVDFAQGTMTQYGTYGNIASNQAMDYDASRRQYAKASVCKTDQALFLKNSAPETVARQVAKNKQYVFMTNTEHPDGTHGVVKTRFIPYDEENQIYIMTRTDVTDLLRTEEAKNARLKEALSIARQANSAKSDFLSSMSHDMRTPMNAIIGMCELAIADEADAEQVHESLSAIRSSSQLLLTLINNILDMSRIESGKMTLNNHEFFITQEVQRTTDSFRTLAEQKGQNFQVDLNISHDCCCGDAARIHSVLDNILSNAIKYTPVGGTITYHITESVSDKPGIGRYRFEISDNGVGMDAETQKHLFEPFYRAKDAVSAQAEGTGLGLSIAKAIVDLKGGTISVKSAKGMGTTFVVELPIPLVCQQNADSLPKENSRSDSYDLSRARILLCEDHPVNQKVAVRILQKAGAEVTVAADGQEGSELFLSRPAGTFNVILMDVRMPKMDGYETTKVIRASSHPQAATIPIIAMTANAFAEDVQKSMAAGMNNHLAKPIVPVLLYQTILRYLPPR